MPLFGLADYNDFYCSCELVFHPDLNGRPVVVLSNNDGCIIARSNESKALGLKMGDAFYQVRDVLESNGVAVFSSNYTLYGDMSKRVMSLLSQYTPQLDIYSIDEAFLDLSGMGGGQQLTTYAKGMVRHVTRGTAIPLSLGIAPTKTLAKMASKFAKNYKGYGGVCLMDTPEKRIKALSLFPIGDVWGIGRRHAVRLDCCGVKTALHFAEKKEGWVRSLMGVTGVRTWRELRGESCIGISEHEVQGYLFDTVNRPKQQHLQKAIDEINHKNGYNKIRLATQGFDTRWHLKNEYLSKQYTTNIDDILVVKCK